MDEIQRMLDELELPIVLDDWDNGWNAALNAVESWLIKRDSPPDQPARDSNGIMDNEGC